MVAVVLIVALVVAGCTPIPGSNTRVYKTDAEEQVVLAVLSDVKVALPRPPAPGIGMRSMIPGIDVAIGYLVKLVAYLINEEAKTYEGEVAQVLRSERVTVGATSAREGTGTVILFARSITMTGRLTREQRRAAESLPTLAQANRGVLVDALIDDDDVDASERAKLGRFIDEHLPRDAGRRLQFVSVSLLRPARQILPPAVVNNALVAQEGDFNPEQMELRVSKMLYPGMKAKAANIPLTEIDNPQSLLSFKIEGRRSDPAYDGQRMTFGAVFKTRWNPQNGVGDATPKLRRSEEGKVPHFSDGFVVTAQLLESSDMKKTLERLSTEVGKIKFD
jgi:hypothetical protein